MYTLRKIIDGIQHNQSLGDSYQVVDRLTNYEEFCRAFLTFFNEHHVADTDKKSTDFSKKCYAIIICKGGSEFVPLYINQQNYIMTESGKTFSNLTFK